MASEQPMPKPGQAPKRRLRNYLLDPRFQLKYTGMVVLVTVLAATAVGIWLGREAYVLSTGMTAMNTMRDTELEACRRQETGEEMTAATIALIEDEARAEDARVLRNIIIGIATLVIVLAIVLGLTGIVVTHKVVGPAYKLRLMLGDIERGSLAVKGGFRKGDELQALGDAFKRMVLSLRSRREEEIAQLDAAIERARGAGLDAAVIDELSAVRARWREPLERS